MEIERRGWRIVPEDVVDVGAGVVGVGVGGACNIVGVDVTPVGPDMVLRLPVLVLPLFPLLPPLVVTPLLPPILPPLLCLRNISRAFAKLRLLPLSCCTGFSRKTTTGALTWAAGVGAGVAALDII